MSSTCVATGNLRAIGTLGRSTVWTGPAHRGDCGNGFDDDARGLDGWEVDVSLSSTINAGAVEPMGTFVVGTAASAASRIDYRGIRLLSRGLVVVAHVSKQAPVQVSIGVFGLVLHRLPTGDSLWVLQHIRLHDDDGAACRMISTMLSQKDQTSANRDCAEGLC